MTVDVPAERTPDVEKGVVGKSLDSGAEFEERLVAFGTWVLPESIVEGCDVEKVSGDRSGSKSRTGTVESKLAVGVAEGVLKFVVAEGGAKGLLKGGVVAAVFGSEVIEGGAKGLLKEESVAVVLKSEVAEGEAKGLLMGGGCAIKSHSLTSEYGIRNGIQAIGE